MFDFLWWMQPKEKPARPAPVKPSVDVLLDRKVTADVRRIELALDLRQCQGDTILSPIIDVHELQGG